MSDLNASNAPKSGGLTWSQKVAAAIGALTLIVGAVTAFMLALPQLFNATNQAFNAGMNLMASLSSRFGMTPPIDVAHGSEVDTNRAARSAGPKPGPDCHQVFFTDKSTIPETTTITWKCGGKP